MSFGKRLSFSGLNPAKIVGVEHSIAWHLSKMKRKSGCGSRSRVPPKESDLSIRRKIRRWAPQTCQNPGSFFFFRTYERPMGQKEHPLYTNRRVWVFIFPFSQSRLFFGALKKHHWGPINAGNFLLPFLPSAPPKPSETKETPLTSSVVKL